MPSEITAVLRDAAGRRELRLGVETELTLRVTNRSHSDITEPVVTLSLAPLCANPVRQSHLTVAAPAGWPRSTRRSWPPGSCRRRRGRPAPRREVEARIARVQPDVPVGNPLLPLVVSDRLAQRRSTIAIHVLPGASSLPDLWPALEPRLHSPGDPDACEIAISRRPDAPERSDLLLTLRNTNDGPLIAADWGPWPPTLTLVFPTAKQPPFDDALTTPGMLDDVEVTIEHGTGWRVVKRRPGPEWDIVAVASGGRCDGLAKGEQLELCVRRLTTDFPRGEAKVELRSCGFPGYADSVEDFTVHKRAYPMRIVKELTAERAVAGTARVSWTVEHASLVQLSGVGEVPDAAEDFPVPVRRDTVLVLTAIDALQGEVLVSTSPVEADDVPPPGPFPNGTILAWNDDPVPAGFAPCDGTHPKAPDLRGRFIRGAGHDLEPCAESDGGHAPGHDVAKPAAGARVSKEHHSHAVPGG